MENNECSSIFGFTKDLTVESHVPAKNKTVILLSSQHYDNTCMGEEKDHKANILMHYNATKRDDVLDKLVREHTCTKPTRRWPLTLFLNLIGVACVDAFVLWMLKYPNWKQRRIIKDACMCFLWEKKW